jgi:hypothetical protein
MQHFEMWLGSLVPHYLRTRTRTTAIAKTLRTECTNWSRLGTPRLRLSWPRHSRRRPNTTSSRHCRRRTGFELSYGPGATSERAYRSGHGAGGRRLYVETRPRLACSPSRPESTVLRDARISAPAQFRPDMELFSLVGVMVNSAGLGTSRWNYLSGVTMSTPSRTY